MQVAILENPNLDGREAAEGSLRIDTRHRKDLDVALKIRKYIPNLNREDKINKTSKDYYQGVLNKSKKCEEIIIGSRSVKSDVDAKFGAIQNALCTILYRIAEYKRKAHQERYNPSNFDSDLEKVEKHANALLKLAENLAQYGKELEEMVTKDDAPHFGGEISEADLKKYLSRCEFEMKSKDSFESACAEEVSLKQELNRKVAEKDLNKEKAKELETKVTLLKEELEATRLSICKVEKEKELILKQEEKAIAESGEMMKRGQGKMKDRREARDKIMTESLNLQLKELNTKLAAQTSRLAEVSLVDIAYHYIFVLDHSGSMAGKRWEAVLKAMKDFVARNKTSQTDFLSMIIFSSHATEHLKKVKISEYQEPKDYEWEGTNFSSAFEMAKDFAMLGKTQRPVVIFLTDGEDSGYRDGLSILREMNARHKHQGFLFFSIGVGDGFNQSTLTEITKTANDGELYQDFGTDRIGLLHTTKVENELTKTFEQITQSIQALPEKIKKSIQILENEKEKLRKETEREMRFDKEMSDDEFKYLEKEYQRSVAKDREMTKYQLKVNAEKVRYLKEKEKSLQDDIIKTEESIIAHRSFSGENLIASLKERLDLAISEREEAKKFYESAAEGRRKYFEERRGQTKEMGFAMEIQALDFYDSNAELRKVLTELKIAFNDFKNFIEAIAEGAKSIETNLRKVDRKMTDLTEDGAFDIVMECYQKVQSLSLNEKQDHENMKKIASYILGIKNTDHEALSWLNTLVYAIHPRSLANPHENKETQIQEIKNYIENDCQQIRDKYENEIEEFKKDIEANETHISEWESKAEDEIEKLAKAISTKTKEIKRLKNGNDDQRNDKDIAALEDEVKELKGKQNKIYERSELEEPEIDGMRKENKEIRKSIRKVEQKIIEMEAKQKRDIIKVTNYYLSLRKEMLSRVEKYVNVLRIGELDSFYESTKMLVLGPIQLYFKSSGNNSLVKQLPALTQEFTGEA